MDGESVLNAGFNGLVLANVGEAHVLAIPLKHLVQALETPITTISLKGPASEKSELHL